MRSPKSSTTDSTGGAAAPLHRNATRWILLPLVEEGTADFAVRTGPQVGLV